MAIKINPISKVEAEKFERKMSLAKHAVFAALVLCTAFAAERTASIAKGDPYPDPADLQDEVRAEISRFQQAKLVRQVDGARFRELALAPAGSESEGSRAPGKADTNGKSQATMGVGGAGVTPVKVAGGGTGSIVAALGQKDKSGAPTTVTVSITIEGSTGPNKGDTDLKKSIHVLLANNAGVPVTAVTVALSHYGEAPAAATPTTTAKAAASGGVGTTTAAPAAKKPALRRRLLAAASPGGIRVEATIEVRGRRAREETEETVE